MGAIFVVKPKADINAIDYLVTEVRALPPASLEAVLACLEDAGSRL